MKVAYVPDSSTYLNYYLDQAGYGHGVYFQGTPIQRGRGFGGLFGKLYRMALPLFQRGTRHVGQALARTGMEIAKDVVQGGNLQDSRPTKTNFKKMGHNLLDDAVGYIKK